MSDSTHSESARAGGISTVPRAVIHKKILDAAATNPDASMAELGDLVSGASVELVEQVLDDYGDPGTDAGSSDQGDGASAPADDASEQSQDEPRTDQTTAMHDQDRRADVASIVRPSDLTEKQRETLRAIAERPEATQAELADELGVSGATINTRVNSIPGFDWASRQEFADAMIDNDRTNSNEERDDGGNEVVEEQPADESRRDRGDRVADLERRLERLETTLESEDGECNDLLGDADLVHKLVHACMVSERISEDEELRILEAVLR